MKMKLFNFSSLSSYKKLGIRLLNLNKYNKLNYKKIRIILLNLLNYEKKNEQLKNQNTILNKLRVLSYKNFLCKIIVWIIGIKN